MVVESDKIENGPKIKVKNGQKSENKIIRKYDFKTNDGYIKYNISKNQQRPKK